jgi:hypothetical protein
MSSDHVSDDPISFRQLTVMVLLYRAIKDAMQKNVNFAASASMTSKLASENFMNEHKRLHDTLERVDKMIPELANLAK